MCVRFFFTFLSSALHSVFGGWMPCCRFHPSCSQYASQAFAEHGWVRGSLLIAKRLARCRPGAQWGFDPVPPLLKTNLTGSYR